MFSVLIAGLFMSSIPVSEDISATLIFNMIYIPIVITFSVLLYDNHEEELSEDYEQYDFY